MAKYTDSELLTRIEEVIYTNNTGDIDAIKLKQLLIDFMDSKLSSQSSTSGIPVYSGTIAANNLVDNGITITHNLNTLIPVVYIKAANGYMYGQVNFSYKAVDADNVLIQFEDVLTPGSSVEYIVVKFKSEAGDIVIPSEPIGDIIFVDEFEEWNEDGYNSVPKNYFIYSPNAPVGEFWRVAKEENDNPQFILHGNLYDKFFLVSNIQMFKGYDYYFKVRYKSNAEVKILVTGTYREETQLLSGYGGDPLPNTNGEWAEIEWPVVFMVLQTDYYTHYFTIGFYNLYGQNIEITFDKLTLYMK